jgi:TLC domain
MGVIGMQCLYRAIYYGYEQGHTACLGLPAPSEQVYKTMASNNDKYGRPDLFAFQIVSGSTFLIIGSVAFYVWHKTDRYSIGGAVVTSPEQRLYGSTREGAFIALVNLAYQIWDFGISLTIPEHCTPIMMAHHATAATVAWSGVYNDMMGYYAIFFLGLSEVSSIFLVSLDMSKYFQPLPGTSLFVTVIEKCTGPLFVVSFIYYRVILWWPISRQMFNDIRQVMSNGRAESLRPGKTWILFIWMILNVPMGLLQLYWVTIILAEIKVVIAAE